MKLGAVMMARNAQFFIGASISSLNWVDNIYLYDDNSTDATVSEARRAARVPLVVELGREQRSIFDRGEMECRNSISEMAFQKLGCDVLVLIDSDELMSRKLRPIILNAFEDTKIDSLCFSIWHLFDTRRYLHFWETHMNGVYMIDPHIRVIRRHKKYQPGYADGSHPFIKTNDFTRCVHGPYHFHLKYHHGSPHPNYALSFLPEHLSQFAVQGYLRDIPFQLPPDIERRLSDIDWNLTKKIDTDYYRAYDTVRIPLTPTQAHIHPRDSR